MRTLTGSAGTVRSERSRVLRITDPRVKERAGRRSRVQQGKVQSRRHGRRGADHPRRQSSREEKRAKCRRVAKEFGGAVGMRSAERGDCPEGETAARPNCALASSPLCQKQKMRRSGRVNHREPKCQAGGMWNNAWTSIGERRFGSGVAAPRLRSVLSGTAAANQALGG